MLRITPEQSKHFEEMSLIEFACEAAEYLRSELPEFWAEMEYEAAVDEAQEGIASAHQIGFEEEEDVLRFLELRTLVGRTLGMEDHHDDVLRLLIDDNVVENWPASRETLRRLCEELG